MIDRAQFIENWIIDWRPAFDSDCPEDEIKAAAERAYDIYMLSEIDREQQEIKELEEHIIYKEPIKFDLPTNYKDFTDWLKKEYVFELNQQNGYFEARINSRGIVDLSIDIISTGIMIEGEYKHYNKSSQWLQTFERECKKCFPESGQAQPQRPVEPVEGAGINAWIEEHQEELHPWERIPENGIDRMLVKLLHEGYPIKNIEKKLSYTRAKVRLSELRKQFGSEIIPTRKTIIERIIEKS